MSLDMRNIQIYVFPLKCIDMVTVLKKITLFSFCSQIKCWLSRFKPTKCFSEDQTEKSQKTLIRLILQKQSDLGLRCLGFFWQTSIQNIKPSTILLS